MSVLGRVKPLCRCSAANQPDCERIVAAAEASDAILTVGYIMRFAPAIEWDTAVLVKGLLGDVRSFDITLGQAFDWGIKSNSLWPREVSRGGVLMDFGTHTWDLVSHWFGEIGTVSYRDDNFGGVGADCLIELKMQSGAMGRVELSKTRDHRNVAIIEETDATLEVSIFEPAQEINAPNDFPAFRDEGRAAADLPERLDVNDWIEGQMRSFLEAVKGRTPPRAIAKDGLSSVRLIETCYGVRQSWDLGSVQTPAGRGTAEERVMFRKNPVLVTGATKTIGCRLVEKLVLEHGANARCAARSRRAAALFGSVWLSPTRAESVPAASYPASLK